MATVAGPYGLNPINLQGGRQNTGGSMREFVMTTNSATGIFYGDLVSIVSGQPAAATATPTTTVGANTPIGVCVGVRYQDPTLKQFQYSQFLPANAITNGYLNVWIRVCDDPDQLYVVQADGAVARSNVGKNSTLGGFSAGSTTTGRSAVKLLTAGIAVTATLAVRIVDFVESGTSTAGDAFTDVIVRFNNGVHAYQNPTAQ